MKPVRLAAALLALGAAFAGGLFIGRRSVVPPPRAFRGFEVRAGRQGLLNPLLECEVDDPGANVAIQPFAKGLSELIASLERDPQVNHIAAYYRDLNDGPWVGHHEQDGFIPASLAKLPVVLAGLRQAENDPGFLSRPVLYRGVEVEKDARYQNPEVNLEPGRTYTVRELIERVATYSDNASALLLAGTVEPQVLEAAHEDLGLVNPFMMGNDARFSPKEYASLFRVLYNASYLNRPLSEYALELLSRSTFEKGLVAGVPQGIVVSHKFGMWDGAGGQAPLQLHDCGIVYHAAQPYLLCVMTSGTSLVRMAEAIGAVSRLVYQQVDQASRKTPGTAR